MLLCLGIFFLGIIFILLIENDRLVKQIKLKDDEINWLRRDLEFISYKYFEEVNIE